MLQLSISDGGTIARAKHILGEYRNAVKRSLRNAAVDCRRSVASAIPVELSARYALSKAAIRKQMHVRNVSKDHGMIQGLVVSGSPMPLMKFEVSPKSPPDQKGIPVSARGVVSSSVVRGKVVTGVKGWFVARMKSGHTGVFHKKAIQVATITKEIDEEFRLSVPQMVVSKHIGPKIEKRASEVLVKALERNVKAELAKISHGK